MTHYFINTKYRERGITTEDEFQRIMALAANLFIAKVRVKKYKINFHPDPRKIEVLNWSSPLLKQLEKGLTKSDMKQEFFANASSRRL